MKLSILTPTIPERHKQLHKLCAEIQTQIQFTNVEGEVEHLVLCDNRARSIGEKRQALLDIAKGDYIAFVDDDDWIGMRYVAALMEAIEDRPDVITFRQFASYNGQKSEIIFKLRQADGPYVIDGVTERGAWHVCAWRRELVKHCQFLANNYGEDLAWCRQARKCVRTEIHIDEPLHVYEHDAETTAAPELT